MANVQSISYDSETNRWNIVLNSATTGIESFPISLTYSGTKGYTTILTSDGVIYSALNNTLIVPSGITEFSIVIAVVSTVYNLYLEDYTIDLTVGAITFSQFFNVEELVLPSGPPGPQGPEGPIGPVGPIGPQGPQGPIGPVGAPGPEGGVGQQGAIGPVGLQGPQGLRGEKGDTGDKGDKGDTGPQGPRGDKGEQGDPGPRGLVGPQGSKGDKGDKGDRGEFSCPQLDPEDSLTLQGSSPGAAPRDIEELHGLAFNYSAHLSSICVSLEKIAEAQRIMAQKQTSMRDLLSIITALGCGPGFRTRGPYDWAGFAALYNSYVTQGQILDTSRNVSAEDQQRALEAFTGLFNSSRSFQAFDDFPSDASLGPSTPGFTSSTPFTAGPAANVGPLDFLGGNGNQNSSEL